MGTPAGNIACVGCGGLLVPGRGYFSNGQLAALRITASSGGFSVYLNRVFQGGENSPLPFSDNIIWFFMDDFTTLTTHPDTPEAGSGYIESISITITPLPAALPLFATGIGALGLLGWYRRRI